MSTALRRFDPRRCVLALAAVVVLLGAAPSVAHAAFGLTKLRLSAPGAPESYAFAPGNTILGEGSVDPNRHYQVAVYNPAGELWYTGFCLDSDDGGSGTGLAYVIPLTDPPSGATAWRVELRQYDTTICAGTPQRTDSLHYTLGRTTVHADAALSQPTATVPPGATAYVTVNGIGKVKDLPAVGAEVDWRVRWIKPSGAMACENSGLADRPESTADGRLPGPPASFLQYPPNRTDDGDPWNREGLYEARPCPALTLADRGTWRVRLEKDGSHVVTLPAFRVDDAPLAPTIDASPPSPGSDRTPGWSFSGAGAAGFECLLERDGAAVADWAACSSPRTYDLTAAPDGSYRFSVRGISATGARGPVTTSDYALDTAAPPPPAIDSGPASPANDPTPEWSFTGTGGTLECRLAREDAVVSDWAACTSPEQYDLAAEPDGVYGFSVRERSAAGVASAATGEEYVLDTIGPAVVIGATPASPGNDATPEWEFSAEPGATFECRLERDATVVANWTACASPRVYDLSGEPDGTYRLLVRATDAAGNTGATVASDYLFDSSAPPAPTIDAAPPARDDDRTPEWSFSGGAGDTFECRLERESVAISDWTACSSPRTYDLGGQPDGAYRFAVRAVSAAGNTGAAAIGDYTLDTSPPAPPTIAFSPGAAGSNPDPMWYFEGAPGETFECHLGRGATVISGWASCASPRAYDLAAEPDGTYTFSVRATDEAGNVGAAQTDDYSLDRDPPETPTITFGPGARGSNSAPAWSFAGAPGETFDCRVERGAEIVSDWAECSSPQGYDLSTEPDGGYRFSVRAVDAAGNAGSAATGDYELDTTAPAPPTIDSTPRSPGNDRAPGWSFTGETGASPECRLERGGVVVAGWAACSSPRGYDLAGLPDGDYVFAVRETDSTGNTSAQATSAYELDTAAPAAPAIDSAPASPGNDRLPGWRFSSEAGAALECRMEDEAGVIADWAACASPKGYDLAGLPDGRFTFLVRASDAAGNTGAASTSAYDLDTAAPAAPVLDSAPASPGSDRTPRWAFSGEAGAALECRLDGDDGTVGDWAACSSPHEYDLAGQPDGTYAFAVRSVDAAGNASGGAGSAYALDTTGPVTTIDSGPASPGATTSPSWSFSASEPAAFECALFSGSTAVSGPEPCTSPMAFDLTGMADGVYTFQVQAADALGNVGAGVNRSYQLRTASPPPGPPPSDSPPPPPPAAPAPQPAAEPLPDPPPPESGDEREPPREPRPERDRRPDPAPEPESDREPAAPPPQSPPPAGGGDTAPVAAAPADLDEPAPPLDEPSAAATGAGDQDARPNRGDGRGMPVPPIVRSFSDRVQRLLDRAAQRRPGESPPADDEGEGPVRAALATAGDVVKAALERPETAAFPMVLLLMVGAFLAVQNRIDRNDPKLALAPVFADDDLEFESPSMA